MVTSVDTTSLYNFFLATVANISSPNVWCPHDIITLALFGFRKIKFNKYFSCRPCHVWSSCQDLWYPYCFCLKQKFTVYEWVLLRISRQVVHGVIGVQTERSYNNVEGSTAPQLPNQVSCWEQRVVLYDKTSTHTHTHTHTHILTWLNVSWEAVKCSHRPKLDLSSDVPFCARINDIRHRDYRVY